MTQMRAKMVLTHIEKYPKEGETTQETLDFRAVAAAQYPADGSDEDNTYAKFSPSASLTIAIANPALLGKFTVGEKYYVDFTPAE